MIMQSEEPLCLAYAETISTDELLKEFFNVNLAVFNIYESFENSEAPVRDFMEAV